MSSNYDEIKKNITTPESLANLISGKYACLCCAYKDKTCRDSYMEYSCLDGITEFLYANAKKIN